MRKAKKYGVRYEKKELLKNGDIKKIAEDTGYAYMTVVQQLGGARKMTPLIKAAADKYAAETQRSIEQLFGN